MSHQSSLSLDFREFRPSDYDRLVEINNANYPGYAVSVAEQRARDQSLDASNFVQKRCTCVDAAEKIVGFGGIRHVVDTFHPKKFVISILVDPALHHRGIGSAIYRWIDQELGRTNAITAWAVCKEDLPVQRAFFRRRGFQETTWDWESSFDLATFDMSKFRSCLDKMAQEGIAFTTLTEERLQNGVGSLQKIHQLTELVMADAPRQGPFTPRTYEQWEAFELNTPRLFLEGWLIAKHGREYVGLSNVLKNEKDPRLLSTGDTGVLREYRGRGIATALKIKVIEYARNSGYERIETWNDSTNSAMLAVNTKLGFKRKIGWVRMERKMG